MKLDSGYRVSNDGHNFILNNSKTRSDRQILKLQGKIDYYNRKGSGKNLSIIGFGDCYITLLEEIPYSGQINRGKAVFAMKEHIKNNLSPWLEVIN